MLEPAAGRRQALEALQVRNAHAGVRTLVVKERIDEGRRERCRRVLVQLHEGADHRVESRDARGVQVRVVLHEACGEVEQGRERVEKHGEDDERDRADAARMGAGHVEREHRRIVETLEELDVRGAPAREPAEDVGDGDVDEEAEHAVEVAHVCGLVGGERDDLVLPEQVRDVREDDDAAPEAPAREHDVGVRSCR